MDGGGAAMKSYITKPKMVFVEASMRMVFSRTTCDQSLSWSGEGFISLALSRRVLI